jgi:prepilin-type N-terminal cleavage/methylation domain-containing protein
MRRSGKSGFTLLEIAVALAILGVGIVSCLQIFGASLRLADRTTRETNAVRQARAAMDKVLAAPDFIDRFLDRDKEETTSDGYTTRVTSWTEPVDEHALAVEQSRKLYHIFVSVTWQDGRGSKTYSLESLRMAPENG